MTARVHARAVISSKENQPDRGAVVGSLPFRPDKTVRHGFYAGLVVPFATNPVHAGANGEASSKEAPVPTIGPYYSVESTDPAVHHNKSNCPDGERIKPQNKRYGTGGRPLCKECPKVG